MLDYLYIPIILFLYFQTWKYRYLIDDPVPRDGYLYEMARKEPPSWYDRQRPILATVANVGVFLAVCGYIQYLFGWKASLLYAVMPLNVSGVAWITGNYYMSTVLLTLASLGALKTGLLGAGIGALFYGAALNSTLSSVPFMAVALFFPHGWVMGVPFLAFFFGKRLRTGLKKRKDRHKEMGIEVGKWELKNLLNVPKTLAYYIYLTLFPLNLGFFHTFGKQNFYSKKWFTFLCCSVCLLSIALGCLISPFYTLCWFLFMGIFSQFVVYGQHVSERYTHLANVFACVLLVLAIPDERVFWILATLWFCRSLSYIPAYKDEASLFSYSMMQFKDCPENYANLASYYISREDWITAIKPLLIAERLAKGNRLGIYMNLANCYAMGGVYDKAMGYTMKAYDEAPLDLKQSLYRQRLELNNRIVAIDRNRKKLRKMGVL